MKPEETVDFHLRWTWQKIAKMYNAEAAQFGSTMSVGYALLNIDTQEGTPSTKLGPLMGMEPRSLTRTLKSMEENGLIYRKNDKNDKRMVRVFLTELGHEKRALAKGSVVTFNQFVQKNLSAKQLHNFFEVMDQISQAVTEYQDIPRETT